MATNFIKSRAISSLRREPAAGVAGKSMNASPVPEINGISSFSSSKCIRRSDDSKDWSWAQVLGLGSQVLTCQVSGLRCQPASLGSYVSREGLWAQKIMSAFDAGRCIEHRRLLPNVLLGDKD